jgi:hypothetical protein
MSRTTKRKKVFSVKLFPSSQPLSLCNGMLGSRRSPAATFSGTTCKSSSSFFLHAIPECEDQEEDERWRSGQPPVTKDADAPKLPQRRKSLDNSSLLSCCRGNPPA